MYSLLDVFVIGIGPSSSHTVGPWEAARTFAEDLRRVGCLEAVAHVRVSLFGSLALTGAGHGTDRAVVMGLSGAFPDRIEPDDVERRWEAVRKTGRLSLLGVREIAFAPADILFVTTRRHPAHSNALQFEACGSDGAVLREATFLSVGGGTVIREGGTTARGAGRPVPPFPYASAGELVALADGCGGRIADIALANEVAWHGEDAARGHLDAVIRAMFACIDRGLERGGVLPGGLGVQRRAAELYRRVRAASPGHPSTHDVLGLVSAYAMAVNEENAAGGRVVRAPTNGSAGTVPAVLRYYRDHLGGGHAGMTRFLLTASAVCDLFRRNASISGAEMGCQGEIGVASAMAAAGLAAALGGTNRQVENAAEIALEHHLGLTCDPVGGLVQIPCIERNAMGAVKAIAATTLALHGTGEHRVSLDAAVETMRQTGRDMSDRYKETSLGGLAVNVINC